MKKALLTASGLLALILSSASAHPNRANDRWSLFGDAEAVRIGKCGDDWAIRLTSQSYLETDDFFAGVEYTPRKCLYFDELEHLSTDYALIDGAGGGSPRFQVTVQTEDGPRNIFIYLGTPPNFDDEPSGWESTGNLIGSEDLRFDTTQLGGEFYDDYEGALDLAGDLRILSISLVVDGGWFFEDGFQTVLVDNVRVNDDVLSVMKRKKDKDDKDDKGKGKDKDKDKDKDDKGKDKDDKGKGKKDKD